MKSEMAGNSAVAAMREIAKSPAAHYIGVAKDRDLEHIARAPEISRRWLTRPHAQLYVLTQESAFRIPNAVPNRAVGKPVNVP